MSRPNKLKIAFITYKFGHQFGGAEAYGVELVRELSKRHEVTVIAYDYDPQCALKLPFKQIRISRRWPSWIRSYLFARQSAHITAHGNFDLVHSQMNGWNGDINTLHVRSVRYRWFCRAPFWKRLFNAFSPRIQMYCWLEKQRVHTEPPKQTVVVSEALKKQLQLAYQTDFPFKVITPGVHLPTPDPQFKQRYRRELGYDLDDCLCLLVARSPYKKGLPTLLKALPKLPAHIKLLVVGLAPSELAHLQSDLKAHALEQRVLAVTQTPNIDPYYQIADLYLHPTLNDSFGMAPLEAMSYGLPVIMSDHRYCGFAQYVEHEQQALLLKDPTDPVELSHTIQQLASDKNLQQKLRKKAQALLPAFSWAHIAQQYEQLYTVTLAAQESTDLVTKKSSTKRSA